MICLTPFYFSCMCTFLIAIMYGTLYRYLPGNTKSNKFSHTEEKRAPYRRDTVNSPLIKRLDLGKSLNTYVPAHITLLKVKRDSHLFRSLGLIPSFSSLFKRDLPVSVRIQLIARHLTHISLL